MSDEEKKYHQAALMELTGNESLYSRRLADEKNTSLQLTKMELDLKDARAIIDIFSEDYDEYKIVFDYMSSDRFLRKRGYCLKCYTSIARCSCS